jgi:hypothetical protein
LPSDQSLSVPSSGSGEKENDVLLSQLDRKGELSILGSVKRRVDEGGSSQGCGYLAQSASLEMSGGLS